MPGSLASYWLDPERALRELHDHYNTVSIGRSNETWWCIAYDKFQLNNDDTWSGYGHSPAEAVINCWLSYELDDAA